MIRILVTMLGVALMAMLVACGGSKVDDTVTENYIAQAEEIVDLLNEGNYEEVHATFNDHMNDIR